MNVTRLVAWMIIRDPLITDHCLLVCIFIFIAQYFDVSCMALTAAAVMNSEQTIYLKVETWTSSMSVIYSNLALHYTPWVVMLKDWCLHSEFTV